MTINRNCVNSVSAELRLGAKKCHCHRGLHHDPPSPRVSAPSFSHVVLLDEVEPAPTLQGATSRHHDSEWPVLLLSP